MSRKCLGLLLVLLLAIAGCGDAQTGGGAAAAALRDSIAADSVRRVDSIRLDSIRTDSIRVAAARDTARADTMGRKADSLSALLAGKGVRRRKFLARLRASELARWPVKGPESRPGALLPGHRIVAYYGNPLSKRMGVLGELPPNEMLAHLEKTAALWQKADTTTKVLPALHLIATVAQGKPGPGGKYRLQMTDSLIQRVANWAESRGWLLFVDVQIGHSTVAEELPRLIPFLQRPYVHLALDPEFAMKLGGIPGQRIGTLDASDLNHAIRFLVEIVEKYNLPPKVLVVHRFTQRMLTNHRDIKLDPRVQVVVDMDGFGTPRLKEDAYRFFIVPEPVQFTGMKLFYKNDKPMMTPEQVLELFPEPSYIQYQ